MLNPGDEAVVFAPFYDSYVPMLRRAGADVKLVPLKPPVWSILVDALESAFSERTKLVLMNSPMNPTGKVFDRDELELIADLVIRYDAYAICDEGYEHLILDISSPTRQHRPRCLPTRPYENGPDTKESSAGLEGGRPNRINWGRRPMGRPRYRPQQRQQYGSRGRRARQTVR